MLKIKCILFYFIVLVTANAQEINQLNDKGNRHGLWKGVYEKSKRPGMRVFLMMEKKQVFLNILMIPKLEQ